MLRPLLNASIGEKPFTRLMSTSAPLNAGSATLSMTECPATPLSASTPAIVPLSTAFASVPLDSPTTSTASEKNAATGNDN